MIHVFFIDPLEKLSVKKDSTLLLAATLKKTRQEACLLFEKDFHTTNHKPPALKVREFEPLFQKDGFSVENISLGRERSVIAGKATLLHMRLDPPFDSRYLRYQWMLQGLKSHGVRVVNDPAGVLLNNEKMAAYKTPGAVPGFVGACSGELLEFAREQSRNHSGLVLKPLDLYQGFGVEKWSFQKNRQGLWTPSSQKGLVRFFQKKVEKCQGPVIVQPFVEEIRQGEIRSLFFQNKHLGSILKTPAPGSFLANVIQGAGYSPCELPRDSLEKCLEVCAELSAQKTPWIAFDLLKESIQEVNVTCPGLLVEASRAHKKNLALDIIALLPKS